MTAEPMDPGPLIMRWLDELAEYSEDPAELTRRYLTPEHREAPVSSCGGCGKRA